MLFQRIFVVPLVLIAILGVGLFILSWGDDEPTTSEASDPVDSITTTMSSSTTTTTSAAPVTTSIPAVCGVTPTTSTTTAGDEPDEPTEEQEKEEPLVPTLGHNSSLSTVGLDEVSFGLTVSQATQAAGTAMHNCEPVSDCYRVTPEVAPEGISFVVHEGTIERVDIVGDSPITTVSGAGIGTTDEKLDDLFGDRLERVDLGGGIVDVIFVPADENDRGFRVAFTTADGVVESMRSGRVPLVLEPEPCT